MSAQRKHRRTGKGARAARRAALDGPMQAALREAGVRIEQGTLRVAGLWTYRVPRPPTPSGTQDEEGAA